MLWDSVMQVDLQSFSDSACMPVFVRKDAHGAKD